MEMSLKLIVAITSGVFAVVAFYISAVEHPARMTTALPAAVQEFRASYKRVAPLQATLAVLCFLASASLWLETRHGAWLAGGVLVVAVVPFTLGFMMPINHAILDEGSPPEDAAALSLLNKWERLHAVRTILGLAGFGIILFQLIRG